MDPEHQTQVERDVLHLYRTEGTAVRRTRWIVAVLPAYAKAQLVRAFAALKQQQRRVVRYTAVAAAGCPAGELSEKCYWSMEMERNDQPTCGKGLAAQAALPAKLAELTAASAEVLERHTQALDRTDPAAREELDAYSALVRAHRTIAGEMERLAEQMAGYRDLPMGRHDETVMADPEGQAAAFQRFVAIERDLLALLRVKVEEDEQLLG